MNKDYFVISDVLPGKLNAMVKNIMKQVETDNPNEAVRMVNAGEVKISVIKPKQTKEDIVRFSVTSDDTTGREWIARLKSKGVFVNRFSQDLLRSNKFKATNGVTYNVVILKRTGFGKHGLNVRGVFKEAGKRKLSSPNAEVACLILDKFSDEDFKRMGLERVVVMHKMIRESGGDFRLFSIENYASCLDTIYGGFECIVEGISGFVFIE